MDKATTALDDNRNLARERRLADSSFRLGMLTDGDELFFAVPRELSVLNEEVLRKERKVSALFSSLPPVARGALIRSLVIDEVVSTNALEGIHSTRRQIDELLCETNDSQSLSNKRFRELANLYLGLRTDAQGLPNSAEDIRAIYDKVMQGEDLCEYAPDGVLFRRSGVEVIGNGGKVLHRGLEPEGKIVSAIATMISVASSEEIPATYGAIAARIHPSVLRRQRQDGTIPFGPVSQPAFVAPNGIVAFSCHSGEQDSVLSSFQRCGEPAEPWRTHPLHHVPYGVHL